MKTIHRRNRRKTKKGGNKELIAVQKDGMALQHVNKTYEIVLEAVKQNGNALQFAPEELKDNDVIVQHATQTPHALKYVSPRLKNDPTLVGRLVLQSPYVLEYASPALKDNKEIVTQALQTAGNALLYASPRLQEDEDLLLLSIQKPMGTLLRAPKHLKDDKVFMMKCIKVSPHALEFASPRLKKDKELVMSAVSIQGATLQYASDELRYDPDVIDAAIAQDPASIHFAIEIPHKPQLTRQHSIGYTNQGDEPVCGYHAFSKVILKNIFEVLRPLDVKGEYADHKCNSYLNTVNYDLTDLTPEKCSSGGYLKILFFLHLFYLYKLNKPSGWMACGEEQSIYSHLFKMKIPLPYHHQLVLEEELEEMHRMSLEVNMVPTTIRFKPSFSLIQKITAEGLYIMLFIQYSSTEPGHFVVIVGTDGNEILYKDSYGIEKVYRFIFGKRFLFNSKYWYASTCSTVIPVQGTMKSNTIDAYLESYRVLKSKLSIDGS